MIFRFSIPLAIVNKAHQANQTYPFAVSLIESVRAYERTLEKVPKKLKQFAIYLFFVEFVWSFFIHIQLSIKNKTLNLINSIGCDIQQQKKRIFGYCFLFI